MIVYQVAPANKTGTNAANTVLWELRASATRRMYLRELGVFVASTVAAAPSIALARASAIGVTPTTVNPQPEDPADTAVATGTLASAWATAPTFSAGGPYLRNMGLPVTAGAGIIWSFRAGKGLLVPLNASLVIANLNATGATLGSFGMYAEFTE